MPNMPYEAFHPQFDKKNWEEWDAWLDGEGKYVQPAGLTFKRPKHAVSER